MRTALETMSQAGVGSLVIAGEDRKAVGVFTRTDLLDRVVLADLPLATPIGQAMSQNPFMLEEHATAYDAMFAMATHGIRHVLVTDAEGKLTGVVSERDLFSLQRVGLRQIRQSIDGAHNVEALQQAAADVRQLSFNMLAQGVGAEQLTQFISALNDALTRRVIQLNLENHNFDGIEWAWLAFGSEGRDEQTFSTDQDNGIVFAPPEGASIEALKQRFLAYALDVNKDLDRCGFPLCKGNIMASNPDCCLSVSEWKKRFSSWISSPGPDEILNATIFFDFRPAFGDFKLAETLKDWLLKALDDQGRFFLNLINEALNRAPPLGMFRDFVVSQEGKIDLKLSGVTLFVDAARILSLRSGVGASGTTERLRQAAVAMRINAADTEAWIDAFHFIQLLRLQNQYQQGEAGQVPNNLIDPYKLNDLDRKVLIESLRQAKRLQKRLELMKGQG